MTGRRQQRQGRGRATASRRWAGEAGRPWQQLAARLGQIAGHKWRREAVEEEEGAADSISSSTGRSERQWQHDDHPEPQAKHKQSTPVN